VARWMIANPRNENVATTANPTHSSTLFRARIRCRSQKIVSASRRCNGREATARLSNQPSYFLKTEMLLNG